MALDRIFQEYRNLQEYVGWEPTDVELVRTVGPLALRVADELIDDFYAELQRHPNAALVITGGGRQVAQLKRSLRGWLESLFSGVYDEAYVEQRWRIGRRHVEIGLAQNHVHVAFSRIRQGIVRAIESGWAGENEKLRRTTLAVGRLLDLDLTVIQDAYETEYLATQWPVDDSGVRQQRVVSQISERALGGDDSRHLMDQTAILVAECFRADRCEILELLPSKQEMVLRSAYGWARETIGASQFVVEPGGELEFVLERRRTVASEDVRSERRFQIRINPEADDIRSSLWVRISRGADAFGILGVHFRKERLFAASDSDFMLSVSNVLTTALERREAELRRRESEDRLRRLVERLPAGAVYVSDQRIFINSAVEAMTGFDRAELSTVNDWKRIVIEEGRAVGMPDPPFLNSLVGKATSSTAVIRRRDQQERLVEITAFRSADDEVWLLHDITETERRRHRALQEERLAAIGQMITGLAHESRNALQRIRACTEMLEFDLESNTSALELLSRIGRAQDDLQRLFDEVRGFAAPLQLERQSCRVSSIAEEAWDALFSLSQGRDTRLTVIPGPACESFWGDRFRLVQLFRNLFENSLAACADPVRVEVQCSPVREEGMEMVEIRIRDNGPGVSEEARSRVFEPFFTTKTKGTGLGMAIAQRIADAHGGRLTLAESTGSGAEFVLHLPRAGT